VPVWLIVALIGVILGLTGFAGLGSLFIWAGALIVVISLVVGAVSMRRHR
jgi:hypothetical protein